MLIFRLAVKNIRRNIMQSLLTVLGISLSVSIILAVAMMSTTMQSSVQRNIESLGTGKTGIWVEERSEDVASIGTKQEGFEESLSDEIMKNANILSSHPSVKLFTTITSETVSAPKDINLYGIRLSDDTTVRNHVITNGAFPANQNEILVGEELAKIMQVDAGSIIFIQSPKGNIALKVSGVLSSAEGTGTLNNNLVAFADLKLVQNNFDYSQKITSLNLVLKPGAKASNVLEQISVVLSGNVQAFTDPIADAANTDSTATLRLFAFIFALISVFIAVFLIYNTLSSSVEQSRREIGLLRLIGMTNRQIIFYFLDQSLIYAVIGSIIGVGLGMIIGFGLLFLMNGMLSNQSFFYELPNLPTVMMSAGVGVFVTILAGITPAIKASKTSPLEVFKNNNNIYDKGFRFSVKNALGLLFLIVGIVLSIVSYESKVFAYIRISSPVLMFVGLCLLLDFILHPLLNLFSIPFSKLFGLPGKLAIQSLQLHLRRTAVTIGASVIAIGIFIGLMGMVYSLKITVGQWLENANWADVIVFSTSGAEIDDSIIEKIEDYEFIEKINPMRYCFVSYKSDKLSDGGFLFQGFEPMEFQEFTGLEVVEGNTKEAISKLESGRNILINQNLSNMIGLKAGDTLELNTPNGGIEFLIVGTVVDYSDFVHRLGKAVYGSYNNLSQYWNVKGYTIIQCRTATGYTEEFVKDKLMQNLSGEYNIKVVTHNEEKEDVGGSIDMIMSIFYATSIIILIIVFMGIFNTVLINVLFQTREYAVLRTIGCFPKQIKVLIMCQAVAMSIIAYLFAAVLGLFFSKVLTGGAASINGILINFYSPLAIIIILFFVIIFVSIVATLYPQKKALHSSITKVLQESAE